MALEIAHPKGGTFSNPTRLPRKFVAVVKWTAAGAPPQAVAGLLLSVDKHGYFNDHIVISGTPIPRPFKKPDGQPDPNKFALVFDVTGVRHGVRFVLFVYEKGGVLDKAVARAPQGAASRADEKIFFAPMRPSDQVGPTVAKVNPPAGERGVFQTESVNPGSNTQAPHDYFVAYGDLPSGDTDVYVSGTAGTRLTDAATGNHVCIPDYTYSDGVSFWAAFFPVIDMVAHPIVDLKVVYLTSMSVETAEDIELT